MLGDGSNTSGNHALLVRSASTLHVLLTPIGFPLVNGSSVGWEAFFSDHPPYRMRVDPSPPSQPRVRMYRPGTGHPTQLTQREIGEAAGSRVLIARTKKGFHEIESRTRNKKGQTEGKVREMH